MLKTLLLTDIVDSTTLTEELGDDRMSQIWVEHDRLARDLLQKHKGTEADRTDGFLMLFDSPNDACLYAIELHKSFKDLSKGASIDFRARIGIHTGEIILIETTKEHRAAGVKHIEVEGIAKPTAARVMSIARGGQTLVSEEALRAIENKEIKTISHGHWRMKGVAEPMELIEVGDETTNFHPPRDGEKVYRVNLDEGVWVPVKETKNNLTPERDSFIGRKEDLHRLGALINKEHIRLVTLLGPGGTGKTRLSKRFGRMWLGDYPGGVWFCNLEEAHTQEGISVAVAAALDVPLTKGEAVEQLGNAISARGECLIILDNFEQVAQFADQTLGQWLQKSEKAKFVVTSRNLLNLPGEQSLVLEPLPIDRDGMLLFESRAQERKPDFKITDDNREDVIAIVDTLDGMPLAIELAAARITVLQPRQIKEKLKERFKILAGKKGVSKRQQTLRDAIDWSWDLLEGWEKSAIAQCSVFEGGFTLEAAEQVIDLTEFPDAPMVMDALQTLIEKSLIRSDVQQYDINEPWYGMYQSIREYCSEKLASENSFQGSGATRKEIGMQRHMEYYAGFGTEEAIDSLKSHGGVLRAKALRDELDNVNIALQRAITIKDGEHGSLLLYVLWDILNRTGSLQLIEKPALEIYAFTEEDWRSRLRVCEVMTFYFVHTGISEKLEVYLTEGYVLSRKHGIKRTEAILLCYEAGNLSNKGLSEKSYEYARKALELADDINYHQVKSKALYLLSRSGKYRDKPEESDRFLRAALEVAVANGDKSAEMAMLTAFGDMYSQKGQSQDAREYFIKSKDIVMQLGSPFFEPVIIGNIGNTFSMEGKFHQAASRFGQAVNRANEIGDPYLTGYWLGAFARMAMIQGEFHTAIDGLEKSIDLHKKGGRGHQAYYYVIELARAYKEAGNYEAAIHHNQNAIEYLSQTKNYDWEVSGRILLGSSYTMQARYELAIDTIREGLTMAREKNSGINDESQCRNALACAYARKGDVELALGEFKQAHEAKSGTYQSCINLIDWAEALLLHHDHMEAREKLNEAEDLSAEFELDHGSILLTKLRAAKEAAANNLD